MLEINEQLKLKVNEVFLSIEGETQYVGNFCVFVRLTGCNFNCWNGCDTQYALNEGKNMTVGEVFNKVNELGSKPLTHDEIATKTPYSNRRCKYVCITGGEPLLQQQGVIHLVHMLLRVGYEVLLETNGSIDILNYLFDKRIHLVVDYKLPSTGQCSDKYKALWEMRFTTGELKETDMIKFVIDSDEDYKHALWIVKKYKLLEGEYRREVPKLLFGVVWGKSLSDLIDKMKQDKLFYYHNVMINLQAHKFIWDVNKRGV